MKTHPKANNYGKAKKKMRLGKIKFNGYKTIFFEYKNVDYNNQKYVK